MRQKKLVDDSAHVVRKPMGAAATASGNLGKKAEHAMDWFLDVLVDALASRLEHRIGIRERLLSLEDSATYLGLSEDAVTDLVARGVLTPVRPTRKVQFDIRDLDAYIESLKMDGR